MLMMPFQSRKFEAWSTSPRLLLLLRMHLEPNKARKKDIYQDHLCKFFRTQMDLNTKFCTIPHRIIWVKNGETIWPSPWQKRIIRAFDLEPLQNLSKPPCWAMCPISHYILAIVFPWAVNSTQIWPEHQHHSPSVFAMQITSASHLSK